MDVYRTTLGASDTIQSHTSSTTARTSLVWLTSPMLRTGLVSAQAIQTGCCLTGSEFMKWTSSMRLTADCLGKPHTLTYASDYLHCRSRAEGHLSLHDR